MVLLTITGPGPSFFYTKNTGQWIRRGQCPIEQRGKFPFVRGGQGLSKGRWGLGRVAKGLKGWDLEGPGGWFLGSGEGVGALEDRRNIRTDVCLLICSFGRTDKWMDG